MLTALDLPLRELNHRNNDGLDVTLLWHAQSNRVFLAVGDTRRGESFELEVRAADALDAFHHPYAYLVNDAVGRSLAA